MFSWSLLIGGLIYVLIGKLWCSMTTTYLWELTEKVMETYHDKRYARMLWYNIPEAKNKYIGLIQDMLLLAAWPIVCISAVLKAEWNYDRIMRRNCFRKEVP